MNILAMVYYRFEYKKHEIRDINFNELPGCQPELYKAGQNGVLEVRGSAQGFGLDPDFAEQSF